MSDKRQRLVDDFVDAWLADIGKLQHDIDCPKNIAHRFATPLRCATAEVRRAREKDDRVGLEFWLVFLARMLSTVQMAFSDWADAEYNRLHDEKQRLLDKMFPVALRLEQNEIARLTALARGHKTQQEKRKVNLEAALAEYERLLANGHSKRRASTIAGERHGLSPDTLRKQRPCP